MPEGTTPLFVNWRTGEQMPIIDGIPNGAITAPKIADGAIITSKILDATVTNAKLANMAEALIKGRASGAGTGSPQDLTTAEVFTILSLPPARAYSEYLTNSDLSTAIPLDDSIPQIGEGTQILSVSITPKKSTSRIRIRFQGFGAKNAGADIIAALFQDSIANALAATVTIITGADLPQPLFLEFEHAVGSTTTRTYSIRVGASSGTVRMNGTTAARYFGGVASSTLVVEEIFT